MPKEVKMEKNDFRYKWMATCQLQTDADEEGDFYVFSIPAGLVKHNKLKDGDWIITRTGKNSLLIESRKEVWGLE